MNTKRYSYMFSVLAIIALLGGTAFAPQTLATDSGGGTGTLTADGDGLALLRGDIVVNISGNGILWIRDNNGDAIIQVSGNGRKTEFENGWVRYAGFHGNALVDGSQVIVMLSGYDIHLTASGTGSYVLRGNGTYSTGKTSGAWSASSATSPLQ